MTETGSNTAPSASPDTARGFFGQLCAPASWCWWWRSSSSAALVAAARAALPRSHQSRAGRAVGDAGLHRRGRPGAGHHRPADRSFGRRHRRHERLRLGRMARGQPDGSLLVVFLIGCRSALAMGAGNALLVAGLRHSGDRRHARHARDLSRRRHRLCRRRADLGDRAARQLRGHRPAVDSSACRCWSGSPSSSPVRRPRSRASRRIGRNLYALGSNPESARFAGISEARSIAWCSSSRASCAAWSACCGARASAPSTPSSRRSCNLQAISAVVIGGVSIFGGSGSGLWRGDRRGDLLPSCRTACQLLGINQFWLQAVVGAAILVHGHLLQLARAPRRAGAARGAASPGACRRPRSVVRPAVAAASANDAFGRSLARWEVLLVVVLSLSPSSPAPRPRRYFLTTSNISIALAGIAPDGAPRAADDADHHHRRDRHLGRLDGRALRVRRWPCAWKTRLPIEVRDAGRRRRSGSPAGAFNGLLVAYAHAAIAGRHHRHAGALSRPRPVILEERGISGFPGLVPGDRLRHVFRGRRSPGAR